MAKTKQTIGEAKKASDFSSEDLSNLKNPFQSHNPFRDGAKAVFEGFSIVKWENEDYGSGSGEYMAIKLKDMRQVMALSMLIKEVSAYKDIKCSEESDFKNEGGLAEIIYKHIDDGGVTPKLLDSIEQWFEDNKKKAKIKLTPYYTTRYGRAEKHTLTNIVAE